MTNNKPEFETVTVTDNSRRLTGPWNTMAHREYLCLECYQITDEPAAHECD